MAPVWRQLFFPLALRTKIVTERGVVASSKMLLAMDHKVAPESGDEETRERRMQRQEYK